VSLLWSGDGVGGLVEPHYEYEGFYPGSALDQISKMDPEGWDYQMTEAEYQKAREQFEQRVIAEYGQEAWDSYNYQPADCMGYSAGREPGE
jgi:hypothetical protein